MSKEHGNNDPSVVQQYIHLADWIGESPYRLGGGGAALVWGLFIAGAMATRAVWRVSELEPGSRIEYAVVETLANLGTAILFAIALTLVYAMYRGFKGRERR